jgi:hypothetical protein
MSTGTTCESLMSSSFLPTMAIQQEMIRRREPLVGAILEIPAQPEAMTVVPFALQGVPT